MGAHNLRNEFGLLNRSRLYNRQMFIELPFHNRPSILECLEAFHQVLESQHVVAEGPLL